MILSLNLLTDIFNFITHGTVIGLPTILFMIIPFIVGLVLGFLVKKFLKWAIIGAVIVFILAYFGVWGLTLSKLQGWATTYGGLAIHEAIFLIGILPLGIGFIIGLIVGFIFG
jgi:uncharacterized membrane protein (Fun14 family)